MLTTKNMQVEIKSSTEERGVFYGLASTFGNEDRAGDIFDRSAWDKSLAKRKVYPLLWQHKTSEVIGKIEVWTDSEGLQAKGTLNLNDSQASKVADLIAMSAVSDLSVGFRMLDYEPVDVKRPYAGCVIKEADLMEVSVVTAPCNELAKIKEAETLTNEEKQELHELRHERRKRHLQDKLRQVREELREKEIDE